jgi:hypothetical protein
MKTKNWTKILFGLLFFGSINFYRADDYVCFLMMNQEIKNSMQENQNQKNMQQKQGLNLGTEKVNQEQWTKFREVREKINKRLNTVSFALQAIPTGAVITKDIKRVYELQESIVKELSSAPMWIVIAVPKQLDFIDDVEMNIRLLAGIILSYGTINQMEKKERQILLDFARQEIKGLVYQSAATLNTIRMAKQKFDNKKNYLKHWVNRDKKIIEDIIGKVKNYKV